MPMKKKERKVRLVLFPESMVLEDNAQTAFSAVLKWTVKKGEPQ
jgi:hypothetical protein